MNKKILMVLLMFVFVVVAFLLIRTVIPTSSIGTTNQTGMANPASVYCEQQGGRLSIRKDTSGGEYGVCVFANGVECDEWKFFRGECSKDTLAGAPVVNINADTELIKLALVEKDGINLNEVDVVITKDTGIYAEGGITPKQEVAGGGYFFAAKTTTGWKIVASGNGIISCDSLKPYPDFPVDMIPECVDPVTGNPVQR
jgi:putative hemolysin